MARKLTTELPSGFMQVVDSEVPDEEVLEISEGSAADNLLERCRGATALMKLHSAING